MKFLFIHQNFPGQFVHLAPLLAARGHEVVALSSHPQPVTLPGVRVIVHQPQPLSAPRVPQGTPQDAALAQAANDFDAKLARAGSVLGALQALSRDFTPDVVFAHSGWGEPLFVKAVFPRCDLRVYAEYYYGAAGGDVDFDPEFGTGSAQTQALCTVKNMPLAQALLACDQAVSPTQFQKAQHPAALRDRITVIHDGIDTTHFAPQPDAWVALGRAGARLSAQDEIVTFVARQLEPYRGYHVFMRALPRLLRLRPQARVVIVGGDGASYGAPPPGGGSWRDVFLNEVKDQIDPARVHLVGKVPHATLTQLMQVATVHVYLTYPFVLSWSLLEAMSIGCAIVASDTAPVREVIDDGRNGLLTDFFDADALADRVADTLARRTQLDAMRQAARQTVVDRYDLRGVCLPAQARWLTGV